MVAFSANSASRDDRYRISCIGRFAGYGVAQCRPVGTIPHLKYEMVQAFQLGVVSFIQDCNQSLGYRNQPLGSQRLEKRLALAVKTNRQRVFRCWEGAFSWKPSW